MGAFRVQMVMSLMARSAEGTRAPSGSSPIGQR